MRLHAPYISALFQLLGLHKLSFLYIWSDALGPYTDLPLHIASHRLILITRNRDDLLSYLRPFAEEGKVVGDADIRQFFEEKQEAMRARREEP